MANTPIEIDDLYMDYTDFHYELGAALDGNRIFPSISSLKRRQPCSKVCGIVRVKVTLLEVVEEPQE